MKSEKPKIDGLPDAPGKGPYVVTGRVALVGRKMGDGASSLKPDGKTGSPVRAAKFGASRCNAKRLSVERRPASFDSTRIHTFRNTNIRWA